MSQTTDFVTELVRAANTLTAVTPFERRRLIERSISVIGAQRELIRLDGGVAHDLPGFMQDMATLAEMAGRDSGIDILVSAGLLMLAGEIQQLRTLYHDDSL